MILGVLTPLLIHLVGLVVVVAVWGRLPDEVVVHIGPGGQRTGSPMEVVGTLAVMGLAGSLVLAGLAMTVGRTSMSRRLVLGLATGWAAMMTGMVLAFLLPQLGDGGVAFDAPLAIAFLVAGVAGVLAAAGAGSDPLIPSTEPVPADAVRAPAAGDPMWQRAAAPSVRARAWLLVITGASIAGVIALSVSLGSWFAALVLVLAVLLVPLSLLGWRVRIDPAGLHVVSALGVFRQHVPAIEVLRADAAEVDPFKEFGGWGLRTAADQHGTVGVVVRTGEAIAVQRTGGRRFVVTVDDADTGAALLNTMADRARTAPRVT